MSDNSSKLYSNDRAPGVTITDNTTQNRQRITMRHAAPTEGANIPVQPGADVNMPGLRIERHETRQWNASDAFPQRDGLLATARTGSGERARELTPTTWIDIPARDGRTVPMRLAQAEAEGYVARNERGEYVEVPAEHREAAAKAALQEAVEKSAAEMSFGEHVEPMSEYDDAFLTELTVAFKQAGESPEMAIQEAFTNPQGFRERILPKIVKNSGDSEAVWSDIVQCFTNATSRVDGYCRSVGVDPDAFGDWLMNNGMVQRAKWLAAGKRVLGGDARGIKELVKLYQQTKSDVRVPEGVKVNRKNGGSRDGAAWIHITAADGKRIGVSVATARRLGLLKG